MFFNSNSFRALESGSQAAWMQQQLHLQNLSNMSTPGYKTKNLVFDEVLSRSKGEQSIEGTFKTRIVTDENTIVRPDGNNVDVDKESLEAYKAYVQYGLLLDKIKGQFNNYNTVLNSGMK